MNRRNFLSTVSLIGLAGFLAPLGADAKDADKSPPNFIVILCDDLGFGDIGRYGGQIATPNLDRLATEGITLDNYYAPANLCTPSRAGLLTGRHPIRAGLGWEVLYQNDTRSLSPSDRTIANCLAPRYASALVGKWHLGTTPQSWPPTKHGFDYFFGIPYSHDMAPLALFEADASSNTVQSYPVDLPNLQQDFRERAESFIERNRARPFFLELALSAPHLPNEPSKNFAGKSKFGAYGDVVEEIDAIVGSIMAKVESVGLTERTLIVFTSDNGPWFEGSPGPLRDRKGGDAYDGASRVPFIAKLPHVIPANMRSKAIASGLDILPTLCSLASIAPPKVVLDGFDITPVLRGDPTSPRNEILLFNNEDVVGVRTQRWKYVSETYFRGGRSDYVKYGAPQLYDMELGDGENYSVASRHPDILADMQARWAAAVERFKPLRTPRPKTPWD
jgi:arylsulfatase A